jgi:hypothetical protein
MINVAARIYTMSNLAISAGCIGFSFPSFDGISSIPIVAFFSFLFSLPAIPLLYWVFVLIRKTKLQCREAWCIFIFLSSIIAFVPAIALDILIDESIGLFVLPISLAAAAAGILLSLRSVHHLFKTFENENQELKIY